MKSFINSDFIKHGFIFEPRSMSFNSSLALRYAALNNNNKLGEEEKPTETTSASSIQPPVKRRKKAGAIKMSIPTLRYSDFAGIDGILADLRDLVERPFRNPELYRQLGCQPPRGVLLLGPPGCGKTRLAQAIAGELAVPMFQAAGPELISGVSGGSEAKIRELFEQAKQAAPSIIFLDEIDALGGRRDQAQRDMEVRIVAQLLACMDDLDGDANNPLVMVIGATSRPDSLDPALRRAGRFDREIRLGIPDEPARLAILKRFAQGLRCDASVEFERVARLTPGYVAADLRALLQEACMTAIRRLDGAMTEVVAVTGEDIAVALKRVQPSAKREGFAVVPGTTWDEVGALHEVRAELRMAVVEPIRNPALFAAAGLTAPGGVLLWGPPGCGKTLLARAVANEAHSNFISVKGPELLNKWVGESERSVRAVFERARAAAPCVIFFDELDALCPRRTDERADSASARVVNQLLTEMDGIEGRKGVFVIAATNRPDIIDPAMVRPGRLDRLLYVPLPSPLERGQLLSTIGRQVPWDPSVDLNAVGGDPRCEGFSGADLSALVREASMAAIREALDLGLSDLPPVSHRHLDVALGKVVRSVSPRDLQLYERLHLEHSK